MLRPLLLCVFWGLLTDIIGSTRGAWSYSNIWLQIPVWFIAWLLVLWLIEDKGYPAYFLAGTIPLWIEIIAIWFGHLTYLFPCTYKIIIGSSYLPASALIGWPVTSLIVLFTAINIDKKYGFKVSLPIMTLLAAFFVLLYLALPV